MANAIEEDVSEAISRHVAESIASLTFDDLPPGSVERAKKSLLDVLGCSLYGATFESIVPSGNYFSGLGGTPDSRVWHSGVRIPADRAAMINGTVVHATEMSETFPRAVVHPGNLVFPAVLALAEREQATGQDVLLAAVLGYELTIRVGLGIGPDLLLVQGLSVPPMAGTFGAAAASAKLLGLSSDQINHALGIAVSMAPTCPTHASAKDGATSKDLFQGQGAAAGVIAADLARVGETGIVDWLGTWVRAVPRSFSWDPFQSRLGEVWHVTSGGLRFKPRPVMALAQPTLSALYELLRDQRQPSPESIASITVEVSRRGFLGGARRPTNLVSARGSIPFLVGAVLVYPERFIDDPYFLNFLTPELLDDERVHALTDLVEVKSDPEFDYNFETAWPMKYESRVTVTLDSGEELQHYKDVWPETSEMTWEQVAAKFCALTADALDEDRQNEVIEVVKQTEMLGSIDALLDLLSTAPATGVAVGRGLGGE